MEQLFGFPEFYPRNSARESRAVFRAGVLLHQNLLASKSQKGAKFLGGLTPYVDIKNRQ